jgi:hypothetical protein
MADSGIFRINALQGWQRDAILKAVQVIRDRFGAPPAEADLRAAHDGLLEVLDPARRTARLQQELAEAAKSAAERRRRERRQADRRHANVGPPAGVPDRRRGERRTGDRRNRR